MTRVTKLVCFSLALVISFGGTRSLRAQLTPPAPNAQANSLLEFQAKANAQAAATSWLALVDSGQYAESWQTAAGYFHTAITQDGWVTLLKGGFPVFGKVVTRNLKGIAFSRVLPGAPDGQYVVLEYQTDFANSKGLIETVATVLDATGSWKVTGYHIK